MNRINSFYQFVDWAAKFDPRITSLDAKKGTLFRFVPTNGAPLLLIKQDDGFTQNWLPFGEGDQRDIYYVGTGDLLTIQNAIDAAFAAGSGSNNLLATIYIPPGTYTENLTFRPGQVLVAQSAQVAVGAVVIVGQHVYAPPVNDNPLAVLVNLQGLSFRDELPGNTISFLGPNGALMSLSGCSAVKGATGSSFFANNPSAIFVLAGCSSTSYTSPDPLISSNSQVMVMTQCSHQGGDSPLLLYTGSGFCNITQCTQLNNAPYCIDIQSGQAFLYFNFLSSLLNDASGVRIGGTSFIISTFNTINVPDGTGYAFQGTGTIQAAMTVYGNANNKIDPSLNFTVLPSDPS